MADDVPRSRPARAAAERALVRMVHHYGGRPEFVLLGGLVPDLLCSTSGLPHAGTTDVDVQIDLEVAGGGVNTRRLERALRALDARAYLEGLRGGSSKRARLVRDLLAPKAGPDPGLPAAALVALDSCVRRAERWTAVR